MPNKARLDFDGNAFDLVEAAVSAAEERQNIRNDQFRKEWWLYLAYKDQSERDPDMPNIALPKLYSMIENKTPRETAAVFGNRPIAPIVARRDTFQPLADLQTEVLDDLLTKAGVWEEGHLAIKMKILYGTALMGCIPYYKRIKERALVPGPQGMQVVEREVHRLRLQLETWAPWEILVDPEATGLREPGDCRYMVKIQLISKRDIMAGYEQGRYPDLDVDRLQNYRGPTSRWRGEHFGHQMLADLGLPAPSDDDDMGVLLRYESPERYIDMWQGEITLRDGDNPFEHGLINASRLIHTLAPHSQNRFWGIGEAQPNEIQLAMLDDLWNLTFAAHGMANQPLVFFRKGAVDPDDIIFDLGRRIPVDTNSDRPIRDDVDVQAGTGLPRDHYMLPQVVERNIDLVSAEFDPSRGEVAVGSQTATEINLLAEQGSKRQEGTIQLAERVFMTDFALKTLRTIDQFASFDDYAEILGPDQAVLMFTASPEDLPGGHNFEFQGSAQVNELFQKRRALGDIAEVLVNSPTARPGGVERTLLKLSNFNQDEVDDMQLTPDEVVRKMQIEIGMQLRQQAQEQENTDKQIESKNNQPAPAKKKEKAK